MKKRPLTALAIITGMLLLSASIVSAEPPAPAAKTGQTASYQPGDDGALQEGVTSPSPRFFDRGEGTVTDKLTGLMWTKDANLASVGMNWNDAIDYTSNLSFGTEGCGGPYTDWRLPTLKELQSLMDYGNSLPELPTDHPFTNVQTSYYWSSTTVDGSTGGAWIVSISIDGIGIGGVGIGDVGLSGTTNLYYVWPVRDAVADPVFTSDNRITVSIEKTKGEVNRNIFGTIIFTHKIDEEGENLFSDYGGGIWNPTDKENPSNIAEIVNDLNFKFVRYVGVQEGYFWENTIEEGRSDYLFGLAEQIETSENMGLDTSYVLNCFTTTPASAGDFVRFVGNNIQYIEIGNEIGNFNHGIYPADYVSKFLQYRTEMKTANSSIQLGIPLRSDSLKDWNSTLYTIKEQVDYGILHIYPTPYLDGISEFTENYLHLQFYWIENYYKGLLAEVGKALDKPLAITEFNGGWFQWEDRWKRYSLGNALVCAELINIFLNDRNILFANNHDLLTVGFGAVFNSFHDEIDFDNPYTLRPNYYMFKMYADYFGTTLIESEVVCEIYDMVPMISVNASKDETKVYLMVINKGMSSVETDIYLPDLALNGTANIYSLAGENPEVLDVEIVNTTTNVVNRVLTVTLKKHSLTAIVLEL